MTVYVNINGSEETLNISRGEEPGDFQISQVGVEYLEIHINVPPSAPTDDDLTGDPDIPNDTGLLGKGAVTVTCVTKDSGHAPATYGLLSETYTEPKDEDVYWANDEGGIGAYYVKVTNIDPSEYVKKYNDVTPGHTLSDEEQTRTITLKLVDNQWKVDSGAPVEFEVTCENEGGETDHTITVKVTNGTVSYDKQDDKQELSFPVDSGEDATIQLSANSGYALDYAVVDDVDVSEVIGTDGSYTFENVSQDMTLIVVYAKDEKGNIGDDGNDTGDGTPDYRQVFIRYESAAPVLGKVTPELQTETLDVDENHAPVTEPIALIGVATAEDGAEFVQWTCNDVPISLAADLKDDGEKLYTYRAGETYVIQAHFEALPPVVETCKVAVEVYNGTATFNGTEVQGYILARKGEDITITFTPDQGFEYEKATLDGYEIQIPDDGTYTIKSVEKDCKIEVWFTQSEAPEEPLTPPEDLENLLDDQIKVQCVSDSSHLSKIYGVWDGSYNVYDDTDLENGIYIISLNAEAYAAKYNSDQYYTGKDTHNPYGGDVLVVLTWDGEEWTVSSAPIVVRVSCNESTTPEPEAPTKDDLLAQDIQVVVECTNSKVAHADATYNLSDFKDVVVTNAVKNADGTYTFTVNNSVFVDKYNEDNGYTGENKHETDDSGTAQVTLSYTEKDGKGSWTVAPGTSITFKVKCGASDTPELPTIDEILDVLYTKPVLVKCMNENREHEMEDEEYAVLEGTYKIGPLQQDENGDWTCYFEVNDPIPYLKQFINNTDSTQHMILDSNSQQILLVLIDGDWSAPNPDQYITTIEVTCDPTVVGSYDLTFNANGGFFGSEEAYGKEIYVKEDLVAGEHTLSSYVRSEDLVYSSTGEKVIFAGWTTEPQNKQVYRYNDADIPEIVETVTIEDQPVTVWAVWGYDEDEDGVADINEVVITPADITIYTGGTGYLGVTTNEDGDIVSDEALASGLPQPGYHIDLPANIQTWLGNGTTAENLATILHFEYNVEEGTAAGTRNWVMKYEGVYARDASGNPLRYVYTLEPSDDGNGKKIPVRILYKDGDTIVDDDKIDMSATAAHEEYTMTINPGELDQNKIQAKLTKGDESKTLNVFIGTGKLTIRSVVEKKDNTSVIAANESSVTGNEIAAVGNNASYVVNDSEVSIDVTNNKDRVQLLVDKVSDSDEFDRDMENASLTHAGMSDGACETAYLDLVDTENGNTVVTLGRGSMDIYWPMPENADAEGTFKVVHYVGMDRESTVDTGDLPTLDSVQVLHGDKQVSVVTTGGQQYIKFSTDSFSPFALVYETKDPGTDPGTDPDDDKDDDDHYTGGGGNDNDSDPTGNLSIELDVNGGDDEFTFTVYFTDEDGDDLKNNFYYNGDYTGTIGSGDEITLEGGDKIVIRNLPEGTRYEVIIETADGYTYVIDGEEGIIRTGTNEAEFTATRTVPLADPSVTGVSRWLNVTDHIAYLTGYPGGAFGPDNSMTRAEVAQMFYALLNNKNVTITKTFPDVPANAWYATAVNTLASLGMVSGDANGNYRPNDPITRAEFCVIALAFAYEPDNAVCYFSDVSRSDWFYTYVAQAASYGWIGGYTNGNFGPNDRITRAQVTTIVNNMLGRAADRDYVIDHQADLVQFTDLNRTYWGYYQIMEATNAHDYTKSNGTENWR
ncbi:S-layer homology domain-containing protein [Pseudoflavonifractor capillosus]|uniref:S-layer homology domain-containing protein n=1 Tax=Pseudoflavonifractor capillosus TaxID=106588 RepID=UPI00195CA87F|nr:S-layer homology domain-containing protein [Pseudoflavonifractor capillosus]